jgi:tripartite-type tricarboxylate transporter receptor subunit TctC
MPADGAIAALRMGPRHVPLATPQITTPLRNGDPGIAQSQALYKNPLYNAATDFTPAVLITEQPTFLIVRRDLPAENLHEFSGRAGQFRDWHQCHACSLPWRSTRDAGSSII